MKQIFPILKKISYLDKPIIIFSILTVIILLICLIGNNFHLPDMYTDRELANAAAIIDNKTEANNLIAEYENPKYTLYKPFFHLFGLSAAFLLFSIIFRRKSFKDFFYADIFKNKIFVYLWINISYILFACFRINFYMTDLNLQVFHKSEDSRGIPYIDAILEMWFDALKYYPAVNVLFYFTYNTKICSRFYSLIFILAILFYFRLFFETMRFHFSIWSFLIDFYYIICMGVILSAIRKLKEKRQLNIQQN